MKKLTKEQIQEIKESEQKSSELAKKFNVTITAIRYHQSEEFRNKVRIYQKEIYRKMSPKEKKEYFERKRDYQREYHRKKYANDPKYKSKQIENAKKYQKKTYKRKGVIYDEASYIKELGGRNENSNINK